MSHQPAPQPPELIEPGTLLPAYAKVMVVDDELLLIVDWTECRQDALVPTGIAPEDKVMFMENLGVVVGITATVQRRVDKWACGGSKYEVNNIFLTTPPCNPSATELAKLLLGRPVLIEGEFVSYQEIAPECEASDQANPATYGHWVIKTDHSEITFRSNLARHGTPVYEDGALEGFVGKPVEAGDVLRIVAYVTDSHELHAGDSEAYLLAPHAERLEEYNWLRGLIAQQISQLETYVKNGNYRDARLLFAALRGLELTDAENSNICSFMDDVPKNERSIY